MNLLGIDFEDWFHPELIQKVLTNEERKPRVINGIDKIIDWLNRHDTYATFFVVGELLEYQPEILDKIIENGHEIGFHTMYHTRLDTTGFKEKFQDEIKKFDKMTSGKSKGFRAPTFSLNHSSSWLIDILEKNNYQYDSSIVPVKTRLYGVPSADVRPYKISSSKIDQNDPTARILEFPLMITRFLGKKMPAGGGFYLRFLPLRFVENTVKQYEAESKPATFYIHSWELTPEYMPKISLPRSDHFITYHNLGKTMTRMDSLIKKFKFTSFEKYIKNYMN